MIFATIYSLGREKESKYEEKVSSPVFCYRLEINSTLKPKHTFSS